MRRPSWRPRRSWGCLRAYWRRGPKAGPEDGERWDEEQPGGGLGQNDLSSEEPRGRPDQQRGWGWGLAGAIVAGVRNRAHKTHQEETFCKSGVNGVCEDEAPAPVQRQGPQSTLPTLLRKARFTIMQSALVQRGREGVWSHQLAAGLPDWPLCWQRGCGRSMPWLTAI